MTARPATTLGDLLARSRPSDVAIAAPGRRALSHGELNRQIGETMAALNGQGIGRGARLAMVLPNGPASPDDTALMLHTSGTTARPKLVALTQANLAASATQIGAALALGPGDRCFNIMPLFHIHGLIGAVASSLAAGASIFATPGFNALKFFGWLEGSQATWITA